MTTSTLRYIDYVFTWQYISLKRHTQNMNCIKLFLKAQLLEIAPLCNTYPTRHFRIIGALADTILYSSMSCPVEDIVNVSVHSTWLARPAADN